MIHFNQYILWCQSESSKTDDYLLIDGENVKDERRQEAFQLLSVFMNPLFNGKRHIWREYQIGSHLQKFQSETGEETSSALCIYTDNYHHLLIKSHYETLDEVGRRIVYMFCSSSDSLDKAIHTLQEASSAIGKECRVADLHFMEYIEKDYLKQKNFQQINKLILTSFFKIWKKYKSYKKHK